MFNWLKHGEGAQILGSGPLFLWGYVMESKTSVGAMTGEPSGSPIMLFNIFLEKLNEKNQKKATKF